jgi:hypothetical protein
MLRRLRSYVSWPWIMTDARRQHLRALPTHFPEWKQLDTHT